MASISKQRQANKKKTQQIHLIKALPDPREMKTKTQRKLYIFFANCKFKK